MINPRFMYLRAVFCLACLLDLRSSHAECINLDVNKGSSPTYAGTGVAPDSGAFWNPLVSPVASTITLTNARNSSNVVTDVDIQIVRNSGGNFSAWDDSSSTTGNPNPVALMRDYLYGGPYTVTVSQLSPGSHTLFVYAHGNAVGQNSTVSLAPANGGGSGTTGNTGVEYRNIFTPGGLGYSYLALTGEVGASGILTFTTSVNLNGFQLMPTPPPAITSHPLASVNAWQGRAVTLTASAGSLAPVTWQWQKFDAQVGVFQSINPAIHPSAATSSLVFPSIAFGDEGIYRAVAASAGGSVVSNTSTVTVEENPTPQFTIHPAGQTVLTGESVTFNSLASAPSGVSYRWFKNGTLLIGETGSSSTITDVDLSDSGEYIVEAYNSFGSTPATPAVLSVVNTLPIPAFPGAEGPGSTASGGRGGEVYHVTTLLDDRVNPPLGSLRYGLTQNVPPAGRTIVFDVAGTIRLLSFQANDASSNIWLRSGASNITIAGQTAPYPGITIINQGTKLSGTNVILRNLSFRPGPDPKSPGISTNDGLSLQTKNSIIDHVSVGFSDDEGLSATDAAANTTVQYCIMAEGLNYELQDGSRHAFGTLLASETADAPLSMHHNLFSDMSTRNPRIGNDGNGVALGTANEGSINDISNNLIYNWRGRASYDVTGRPARANFFGNYFLAGPSTLATDVAFFGSGTNTRIHHSGNLVDMNKNTHLDGTSFPFSGPQMQGSVAIVGSPFPVESGHHQSATDAAETVLHHAGSFWWNRSPLDQRIIHEVRSGGGGAINTASALPSIPGYEYPATSGGPTYTEPLSGAVLPIFDGLPLFPQVSRPAGFDTDLDGMPDAWEALHGLNTALADHNGDFDADGYSNLEEYINEIAAFPAPVTLRFSGAGGRYEMWKNWNLFWQPSRYDSVLIDQSSATISSPGQHAGDLTIRGTAVTPSLDMNAGRLDVAGLAVVGGDGGTGLLILGGGTLAVGDGLSVKAGGKLKVSGIPTLAADLINDVDGLISVEHGVLTTTGNLTNHGVVRVVNGASLDVGGVFVNHGVVDIMTGAQTLPAGFVNLGTVLDSSHVRVTSTTKFGNAFTVTLKGFDGHSYQLEKATSPTGPWAPVGSAQPGTGAVLTFTDNGATADHFFYRISVNP